MVALKPKPIQGDNPSLDNQRRGRTDEKAYRLGRRYRRTSVDWRIRFPYWKTTLHPPIAETAMARHPERDAWMRLPRNLKLVAAHRAGLIAESRGREHLEAWVRGCPSSYSARLLLAWQGREGNGLDREALSAIAEEFPENRRWNDWLCYGFVSSEERSRLPPGSQGQQRRNGGDLLERTLECGISGLGDGRGRERQHGTLRPGGLGAATGGRGLRWRRASLAKRRDFMTIMKGTDRQSRRLEVAFCTRQGRFRQCSKEQLTSTAGVPLTIRRSP